MIDVNILHFIPLSTATAYVTKSAELSIIIVGM